MGAHCLCDARGRAALLERTRNLHLHHSRTSFCPESTRNSSPRPAHFPHSVLCVTRGCLLQASLALQILFR